MSKLSKRYKAAKEMIPENVMYTVEDAVALLKKLPMTKFSETVEVTASLGVDPRQSEQMVRGTATLPNGTGKTVRVLVFCKGEAAEKAREAGADYVGSDDLVKKIQGGWFEFDVAVATPDMMKDVGQIGRVLGPRGLMPNPKTGTVTPDVAKAVKEVKGGRIEYKMDKTGCLHLIAGKISFSEKDLIENVLHWVEVLKKAKPPTVKGHFLKRLYIGTTMSPSLPLDMGKLGV